MSGIFGSLFGKRKASQPADTSGRAATSSSRTGPGPSSWTGPPPRDPKEWRGPHNPTRSRGNADADDASRQPPVVDLTRETTDHPSSSSPRAARAAARDERRARRERRRDAAHDDGANPGETTNDAERRRKSPARSRARGVHWRRARAGCTPDGHGGRRGRRRGERFPLRRPTPAVLRGVRRPHARGDSLEERGRKCKCELHP